METGVALGADQPQEIECPPWFWSKDFSDFGITKNGQTNGTTSTSNLKW